MTSGKMNSRKIFFILIAVALLVLAYTFIEPYRLEMNSIDIISRDIPVAFNGTRIVFISDIHHGPFFSRERLRGLVTTINSINPDIVLLGGDYVHRDAKYIEPCFQELSSLKAGLGKFGVLGNHDHWEGKDLTLQSMRKAGITAIDNKAQWLYKDGARIRIGGVGDLWGDVQDISPTVEGAEESDFIILVSHSPDYVERITTRKIDLVLSGHTHGGQVTLFGLWAPLIPSQYGQKYRSGMIETDYTRVIVSNGVGTITPPVRFFARPQVNIINLKKEVNNTQTR
ncbi:MAG: metallophosphoesterase [Bacillota bacterium]|nr:metallophosphoesterase [Bacillota bacterium]